MNCIVSNELYVQVRNWIFISEKRPQRIKKTQWKYG